MAQTHEQFWSKVARRYDRVADLSIGPATRSLPRERLVKEGRLGRVVEFGCGTGFFTQALAGKADEVVATVLSASMLAVAKERVAAANVAFQEEDCQRSSFPTESFDTAFLSLVIHFTRPETTLAEMHRILKPGGTLLIVNVDPFGLGRTDRLRCIARIVFHGLVGYRTWPPKGFGKNMVTEEQLRRLLAEAGFRVLGAETIRDASRSSYIPLDYVRAAKA